MKNPSLVLQVLEGRFAVCRFRPDQHAEFKEPEKMSFFSVTRTAEEVSIVLPQEKVQKDWQAERNWRGLKVMGPLDFGMIGVLASISAPLAEAAISIFVVSTYDTDYLFVKEEKLEQAVQVLEARGLRIIPA